MMNEILISLANYSFDHGFNVIFEDKLSPHTPSLVNPFNKTIIINSNWHEKNQLPFQLAHEIGHLINNDSDNSCLYFSPSKYGIEGKANKVAISLLVPFYVNEKSKEQINSLEFMNIFSIPSYLEKIVNDKLIRFNK